MTRSGSRSKAIQLQRNLEASLVLALFDLANHLQRGGERLAAEAQLTTQQWLVLLQIAGDPNFPAARGPARLLASDIARMRGVSRATISAVITALRDKGLIREEPDPDDRRRRYLEVTAAGVQAIARIEPSRHAANQRLLANLDTGERKQLLTSLEHCLAVLWELYEDDQLLAARERQAPR